MRILHVVTVVDSDASYGGPLTVAINQCRELRRRGHEAEIVSGWIGANPPPSHLEGVPATLIPVRSVVPGSRFAGLFSARLMRWVLRHAGDFDAAHIHLARDLVPLSAALTFWLRGTPYVTQTHGMILPDDRRLAKVLDRLITLPVLRRACTRFVLTDAESEALSRLSHRSLETVRIPNGVDVNEVRRRPEASMDVLFMARLHPRKRVLDFARAAATLIGEGLPATFSVVGPDDGDLSELRDFINTSEGLADRLRYQGALPHDQVHQRLLDASIFVLPSVDEVFPMTLLEALATGTPSICTTSCGIAAELAAEDAAVVVPPGPEELTAAVRNLILDSSRRDQLSRTAQSTARRYYSMESVGSCLVGAYQGAALGAAEVSRRVLWVTNVPTPYRAPLWEQMGENCSLTVALMAATEPNRDWVVDLDRDRYQVEILDAPAIGRSGDSTLYGPSLKLLRLIGRRPDAMVLDGWESPAYLAARWWARRRGIPVIASYRSTQGTHRFSRGPVDWLRRWFFHGADGVLTAGSASSAAVRAMGVPTDRIVEGFNTVDVARFQRAIDLREPAVDERGHHFLYVGQFIERKNVDSLIRAFAAMRDRHDVLVLVGTGPLLGELQARAKELEVTSAVRFCGSLDGDDLVRAYAGAHTLVLPSTEEVWGLVVNEGLAAGLHAVVSQTCGIAPSIAGMPGVFLCDPDVAGLMSGLIESRTAWEEPIADHPVTRHTPAELSSVVLTAVDSVRSDAQL